MTKIQTIESTDNLKIMLQKQYINQINNYFGDNKKALKFLSNVVASCQKTPELLDCESSSVINSFMTMAQLELMPSNVSGEAYVLPYNDRKAGCKIAQFQLGYKGLVTLFFRAGIRSIVSEIVYKKDKFSYTNGVIEHSPDVFDDDRGEAIGAYVIVELPGGAKVAKAMSKTKIMNIGKQFSKSFNTSFSPWNEKNDPEGWMWKKTVLIQISKLVPKNEAIIKAISEDYKDSNINDKNDIIDKAKEESGSLTMGNLLKDKKPKQNEEKENQASTDEDVPAQSDQFAQPEERA